MEKKTWLAECLRYGKDGTWHTSWTTTYVNQGSDMVNYIVTENKSTRQQQTYYWDAPEGAQEFHVGALPGGGGPKDGGPKNGGTKNKPATVSSSDGHVDHEKISDAEKNRETIKAVGLALLAAISDKAKEKMFNSETWYSLKMLKTYSRSFQGNQYVSTGLSKGLSTGFTWLGRGIGAYNAIDLTKQYNSGEIGGPQYFIEQSVNAYSTLGPGGSYIGIGWELGRAISKTEWHDNFKENYWYPIRFIKFGY